MLRFSVTVALCVLCINVQSLIRAQTPLHVFIVCGEQEQNNEGLRCKFIEVFQAIYQADTGDESVLVKPDSLDIWTFLPKRVQLQIFATNDDAIDELSLVSGAEAIVILENLGGHLTDLMSAIEATNNSEVTRPYMGRSMYAFSDDGHCMPNVAAVDFEALRIPPKICQPGIAELQSLLAYLGGVSEGIDRSGQ